MPVSISVSVVTQNLPRSSSAANESRFTADDRSDAPSTRNLFSGVLNWSGFMAREVFGPPLGVYLRRVVYNHSVMMESRESGRKTRYG